MGYLWVPSCACGHTAVLLVPQRLPCMPPGQVLLAAVTHPQSRGTGMHPCPRLGPQQAACVQALRALRLKRGEATSSSECFSATDFSVWSLSLCGAFLCASEQVNWGAAHALLRPLSD